MSIKRHVLVTTSLVALALAPVAGIAQTSDQGTSQTTEQTTQQNTQNTSEGGSTTDMGAATSSTGTASGTTENSDGTPESQLANEIGTNGEEGVAIRQNEQGGAIDPDQAFGEDGYGDVYEDDRAMAERTLMLDLDVFAQQIYERAYRRGYMAGAANMRDRFDRRMRQLSRQQDREDRSRRGDDRSRSGMGANRDGGSIIVLPPGVSPEDFIERLQRGATTQSRGNN